MEYPDDLHYSEEHEWVRVEDKVAVIGITDYAQSELGDIVFLELPEVGTTVSAGDECGAIEAVKTVAQLFTPVSGKVVETNGELENDSSVVNRDPYGEGWMMKIELSNPSEVDDLMTAEAYQKQVA